MKHLVIVSGFALGLIRTVWATDWFMMTNDYRCIPSVSYLDFAMHMEAEHAKCNAEQHAPAYFLTCDNVNGEQKLYFFFKDLDACNVLATGMKTRAGTS